MYTIEKILNFKLVSINKLLNSRFAEQAKNAGILYSHYAAMVVIYEHPGIRQMELAQLKATDRTTTGHTVDKLERQGFVERKKDAADKRAHRLYLTESGKEIVESYWRVQAEIEQDVLKKLSASEQTQLINLLDKILSEDDQA